MTGITTANKMDVLRKLSLFLQGRDVQSTGPEFVITKEGTKISKGISMEFDSSGLSWLHTIAPCFAVDGKKVFVVIGKEVF